MAVIYTILIFGAIIFIHELGHFIAARICGVRINEFALGMGPKLLKYQGKTTLYSLRLLPIGGFCAMEGDDASGEESVLGASSGEKAIEEDAKAIDELLPLTDKVGSLDVEQPKAAEKMSDDKRQQPFYKKSVPQRIFICAAGAFMNLLLGFAVILSTFAGVEYYNSTQVAVFKENATSSETGLQVGDKIVKVNKTRIFSDRDIVFEMVRDDDGVVAMEVIRDGERVKLPQVAFQISGEGENKSIYLDFKVKGIPASFAGAVSQAFGQTVSLARNSWASIGDLFTGKIGLMELSGPVGVGQVVGEAAKIGFGSLLSIAAFISISIGMFNVLPFPALDGGRILFLLIEAVRRKPINPKWEGYVNMAGLLLLFGLMIVVTLKDIIHLF